MFKDNKKSYVYISDSYKKGYQKIVTTYHVLEKYDDNTRFTSALYDENEKESLKSLEDEFISHKISSTFSNSG